MLLDPSSFPQTVPATFHRRSSPLPSTARRERSLILSSTGFISPAQFAAGAYGRVLLHVTCVLLLGWESSREHGWAVVSR